MPQLARVVVAWSGPSVRGLAVNVLHFEAASGTVDTAAIRAAYQAIGAELPTAVRITVPTTGELINDGSGDLTNVWTGASTAQVVGGLSAAAAAGVGACVNWKTAGVVNARRLRGRTFICPLSTGAYESDGTLTTAALTAMNNFGTLLRAVNELRVWHRPTGPGLSDGSSFPALGHQVNDKAAYLSSRRD